ncbi:hypothetical protein Naga_100004g139 [Nannochloropsis gaditana]|uniref:Uncharacterized protein n=1 Tax=Nannochloropsis gaditana TaxID=72520 RepID=W7U695_9STRA|nr:hypothetical protein Naga_100004g139 [Nannochloropsis gaditana]
MTVTQNQEGNLMANSRVYLLWQRRQRAGRELGRPAKSFFFEEDETHTSYVHVAYHYYDKYKQAMFDVTGLEVVILIGAASFLLGKKEVPQLARIVGRGTGKLVALLNTAREQFVDATQNTHLSKLTDEVRQNMNELNSIRSEVRAAGLRPSRRMPTSEAVSKLTSPLQPEKEMSSFPKPSASSCGKQEGSSFFLGKSSGSKFSKIDLDKKRKLGELAIAELLLQESVLGKEGGTLCRSQKKLVVSPHAKAGSAVLDDVIFENLLWNQMDHTLKINEGGKVPDVPPQKDCAT